jgi:hypothetical protein
MVGSEGKEPAMKYAIGIALAAIVGAALWGGKDDIRRFYKMSIM